MAPPMRLGVVVMASTLVGCGLILDFDPPDESRRDAGIDAIADAAIPDSNSADANTTDSVDSSLRDAPLDAGFDALVDGRSFDAAAGDTATGETAVADATVPSEASSSDDAFVDGLDGGNGATYAYLFLACADDTLRAFPLSGGLSGSIVGPPMTVRARARGVAATAYADRVFVPSEEPSGTETIATYTLDRTSGTLTPIGTTTRSSPTLSRGRRAATAMTASGGLLIVAGHAPTPPEGILSIFSVAPSGLVEVSTLVGPAPHPTLKNVGLGVTPTAPRPSGGFPGAEWLVAVAGGSPSLWRWRLPTAGTAPPAELVDSICEGDGAPVSLAADADLPRVWVLCERALRGYALDTALTPFPRIALSGAGERDIALASDQVLAVTTESPATLLMFELLSSGAVAVSQTISLPTPPRARRTQRARQNVLRRRYRRRCSRGSVLARPARFGDRSPDILRLRSRS